MRLTILDKATDSVFSIEELDYQSVMPVTHLREDLPENLDGSIYSRAPVDTTHLITWYVDRLGETELMQLPSLKYVGLAFTGWWDKYFDLEALRARNIVVANNSTYATNAVAEAVIATLFSHYRHLSLMPRGVVASEVLPGRELAALTLGVVGMEKLALV